MTFQSIKDAEANTSSALTCDASVVAKKDVQSLWAEYKYRPELIWKNTFQITLAFVALSVIPYCKDVVRALGRTVVAVPFLALALVGFALPIMINELNVFHKIKEKYREKQKAAYCIEHEDWTAKGSFFWFVLIYLLPCFC